MTDIELKQMESDVKYLQTSPNDMWLKAFDIYNKTNGQHLSLGCRPCYFKVLMFHKNMK